MSRVSSTCGLPMFERPIFRSTEDMAIGAATNGGEAMTWHDEFTETVAADWVESVATIAYRSHGWRPSLIGTSMGNAMMASLPRRKRREKAITACRLY